MSNVMNERIYVMMWAAAEQKQDAALETDSSSSYLLPLIEVFINVKPVLRAPSTS